MLLTACLTISVEAMIESAPIRTVPLMMSLSSKGKSKWTDGLVGTYHPKG